MTTLRRPHLRPASDPPWGDTFFADGGKPSPVVADGIFPFELAHDGGEVRSCTLNRLARTESSFDEEPTLASSFERSRSR